MARYRPVNIDIWEDDDEFLTYNTDQMTLFFYLITNKNCTESGVYKVSIKRITQLFKTGKKRWNILKTTKLLKSIKPNVYFDEKKSIVFVRNFLKNNGMKYGNPKFIDRAIIRDYLEYKTELWHWFLKTYPKFVNTFNDTDNENDIINKKTDLINVDRRQMIIEIAERLNYDERINSYEYSILPKTIRNKLKKSGDKYVRRNKEITFKPKKE